MEIFQNTLIKLVVRQGSDSDRKNIILTSGEPAYTTDTKRFFVGDGVLSGGKLTGNLYKGDFTGGNPAIVEPAEIGDLAYDTDSRRLYRLKTTNTGLLTSWSQIGGVYVSGDSYILVDNDNELRLAPLSANSLSNDLVKGPIILDSGKIALSAKIPFHAVSTNTISVSSGLKMVVNGSLASSGALVNPLSSNIVLYSDQMFAKYDGLSGQTLINAKGISSVDRLSAGDYNFNFTIPVGSIHVIPICQIYGIDHLDCQSRVMSTTLNNCNVHILSSDGTKIDANVYLSITP